MLHWLLYSLPWWIWLILAVVVLSTALYFYRNLKVILPIAAAVAAAILLGRARQKGYEDRKAEEKRASDELQKKYDKIDNSPLSVDDAYDELRNRSK